MPNNNQMEEKSILGSIDVSTIPEYFFIDTDAVILPSGNYWFGDPCYVAGVDDDAWQKWVDISAETSDDFSTPLSGAMYNEHPVISANTEYGDGVYTDSDGFRYSVDTGSLAMIAEKLVSAMNIKFKDIENYGTWHYFENDFTFRNRQGVISFGKTTIDTNGE